MFYLTVTLLQQPCKQVVKKSKEESRIINFQRITNLKCHVKNRVRREIRELNATRQELNNQLKMKDGEANDA